MDAAQQDVLEAARFRREQRRGENPSLARRAFDGVAAKTEEVAARVQTFSTVRARRVPIAELMPIDRIKAIADRTKGGGGEIVKLLKTGSAYYAPAAAAVDMAKAIFNDEKKLLAASAFLTGQFGIKDIYIGVPVILGAKGIEKIVELKLSKGEKSALKKSADTYKEHLKVLGYK